MNIAKIELDNGVSINIHDYQLPLTIGRSPTCDIRIMEPFVSRQHCELYMASGRSLWIKDTSSNGTRVNHEELFGDSTCIKRRSSVSFAGDFSLTVTPTDDRGETLVPGFG